MRSVRARAIVNPRSGGKRVAKQWPQASEVLQKELGTFEVALTDAPGAATELTRTALREGVELVIAVGGDGTINEVVNGFFEADGTPIAAQAELGIINMGTGGDFRRSFGIGDAWEDCVTRILEAPGRAIDLGRVRYVDEEGREALRWFDNIASFGVSGAIVRAVDRATWTKRAFGKAAFKWHTVTSLLAHRNPHVRIRVTGLEGESVLDEVYPVTTAAVCNGQFFGGGMWIAPAATVDDGLLDLVVVHGFSALDFVRHSGQLYAGEHLGVDGIVHARGRKIVAEPVAPDEDVPLDCDGEAPGRLPATFEIQPSAIRIRA